MRRPFARPVAPEPTDGLERTDWMDENTFPTIPGTYECATGGMHVFRRVWNGETWISPISGQPTTVKMPWRGVVPGSLDLGRYPAANHHHF